MKNQLENFIICNKNTKAYERSLTYVNQIKNVIYQNKKQKFLTQISGTDIYNVSIKIKNLELKTKCSCPVEDNSCKHVIAFSLYLQKNLENIIQSNYNYKKELNKLTRTELKNIVKLVIKKDIQTQKMVTQYVEKKKDVMLQEY